MDGSMFYRNDHSSSGRSGNRNSTPPSRSTNFKTPETTPLSSRQQRHENAMASSISVCQAQLENVLKKLEETAGTLATLSDRIERVEEKLTESVNEETSKSSSTKGKRKRPKDSLTVQEEVHKLHASREERNQLNGLQSVNSLHNKSVIGFLKKQLKVKGYDEIKVERAAKKFHEHIRRVAQGKVDDDLKAKMRMSNRKGRKYLQRKNCLDPEKEKEVKAFDSLCKEHMSSDEDDSSDQNQWVSRPPRYRSETLQRFLNKLDKVHNKRASKERKFAKKIKRVVGEPKEVDPPENTPLWALSRSWIESREKSMNQQKSEDNPEVDEDDEANTSDLEEQSSSSEESNLDFED